MLYKNCHQNLSIISLCLLVLLIPQTSIAQLSLNSTWQYQDSKTESDEISENYAVNLNRNIEFTEAMSLNTTLRVTKNRTETAVTDNYSPTVSYLLNNDIFNLNLSGSTTEQKNSISTDTSSRSISAYLGSSWKKERWKPSLNVNFSKNWQDDDLEPSLSDIDSSSSGFKAAWKFAPVELDYTFNQNESNDNISGSQALTDNHNAKLKASASFWRNKGRISFTQKYSHTANTNIARVDTITGVGLIEETISAYYAEVDPSIDATLNLTGGLTNDDKTDSAVTVNNPANPLNFTLAVKTDSSTVNKLYLYIDSDTSITVAEAAEFTWDLYSSNNNFNWTLVRTGITATYSTTSKRFEIDISGVAKDYLRVVASTDPAATSVAFSEVEVFQEISSNSPTVTVKTNQTNYTSGANVSFQIAQNLSLSSNMEYQKNDYSSQDDLTSTKASGGISWLPSENLTVNINGSRSTSKRVNSLEDQSRSYGLSVSTPIIPTIDTTFAASLSETYEGREKLTTATSYSLIAAATVYQDLDARIGFSRAENNNERVDSSSTSDGSTLDLTARLTPSLVANLSGSYMKSTGESAVTTTNLTMNWRLSEMLGINSGLNQTWDKTDSTALNIGFDLGLTKNMQFALAYLYKIKPDTTHTTSLSWRWTISRYISLMTSGNYQKGNNSEIWSVNSKLNARFSTI